MSIRRACAVLGGGRSTHHYTSRRPLQAVLSKRIREIAETRVRYRYRRIHVLLRREGWQVNAKRIYRLYTEEGLQLRHESVAVNGLVIQVLVCCNESIEKRPRPTIHAALDLV